MSEAIPGQPLAEASVSGPAPEGRPRPPSPLAKPEQCEEVRHSTCLELVSDGVRAILHNKISGEKVHLKRVPDGARIRFDERRQFGFIVNDSKSTWCSRLLKWHIFKDKASNDLFLCHKLPGSQGIVTRWLDEVQGRRWLDLQMPVGLPDASARQQQAVRILEFDRPYKTSGCCCFWSLQSILTCLAQPDKVSQVTQSAVSTWMRKSWKAIISQHLGPRSILDHHVLTTDRSHGIDGRELLEVDETLVSTPAMLQLLFHFCNQPPSKLACDCSKTTRFTREVLSCFQVGELAKGQPSSRTGLELVCDPQWQGAMHRPGGGPSLFNLAGYLATDQVEVSDGWKSLAPAIRKAIGIRSHTDVLSLMWGCQRKSKVAWVCDQLSYALASFLEVERLLLFADPSAVQKVADGPEKVKPRPSLSDPKVLAHNARASLKPGEKRTAKTNKVKKKKKGEKKEEEKESRLNLVRYFYGCRREMADSKVISIAGDESRVGRKERLYVAAMSEQGITCWSPPQDSKLMPQPSHSNSKWLGLPWKCRSILFSLLVTPYREVIVNEE